MTTLLLAVVGALILIGVRQYERILELEERNECQKRLLQTYARDEWGWK